MLEAKAAALATLGQAEAMERTAAALRTHALAVLDRLAVDEVEHTAELTGAAASRREHELARRSLVAEVATMTTLPEARVSGQWSRAVTCMREQPQTADALLAAEIGAEHAKVLVDELECVSARVREHLLPGAIEKARTCTPAALRRWIVRARESVDPESIERRHRKARAGRNVQLSLGREGMATLSAYLPEVTATAIYNRCTDAALATRGGDDPRALSQLRADAFAAYCPSESPVLDDLVLRTEAQQGTLDLDPAGSCERDPGSDRDPGSGREPRGGRESDRGSPTGQPVTELGAAPAFALTEPLTAGRAPSGASFEDRRLDTATAESLAEDDGLVASSACDVDIWSIRPTVMITVPIEAVLPDDLRVPRGRVTADATPAREGAARVRGVRDDAMAGVARQGCEREIPSREHESPAPEHVAQVVGGGMLDAATARELVAAAPSLRRLLTDRDTGVVLDVSRTTYAVPADLTAFLRLRDETCRFPGCRRRAERCDIDHVQAWAEGGTTRAQNLAHLCRHHHRLKHETGWSVEVVEVVEPDATATRMATATAEATAEATAAATGAELTLRWRSPGGRLMTTAAALTVPTARPLAPDGRREPELRDVVPGESGLGGSDPCGPDPDGAGSCTLEADPDPDSDGAEPGSLEADPDPDGAEPGSLHLSASEPAAPDLVALDPVAPDPVAPDPVAPDPVAPDPVAPDPVAPDPDGTPPDAPPS